MTLTYRVLEIAEVVDGDTLWAVLERDVKTFQTSWRWRIPKEVLIGEAGGRQIIERWDLQGHRIVERDYDGGTKVRLHDGELGLNTPEKKTNRLGWNTARLDLAEYCVRWARSNSSLGMELPTYGKDSFGRTLGNLQPVGFDPVESAVFWMRDKGWEAYK